MKRRESRPASESEPIAATAAAWLAQRDEGPLSPEQQRQFDAWRAADSRHEAALARLEGAWSALQQLREFRPEARVHPDSNLLARRVRARRVLRFPTIAATALAASLAIAAAWWVGGRGSAAGEGQRYATTVDGYERVALADGSLLELNSNSEATVQFTAAERRVRLVRGEAHFTVAKNPARPFSVEAGTLAVRAVGTAFNVRLGASDVEVLVTEGKVEVGTAATPAHAPSPRANGASTPLGASERAIVSLKPEAATAGPVVEKLAPDMVREALAWQGPRLVFSDTPLAEVAEKFNRRNQVQLVVADEALRPLPVGGSFRAENVDAFVRLLESGGDVVADRSDPARIVLRSRR